MWFVYVLLNSLHFLVVYDSPRTWPILIGDTCNLSSSSSLRLPAARLLSNALPLLISQPSSLPRQTLDKQATLENARVAATRKKFVDDVGNNSRCRRITMRAYGIQMRYGETLRGVRFCMKRKILQYFVKIFQYRTNKRTSSSTTQTKHNVFTYSKCS